MPFFVSGSASKNGFSVVDGLLYFRLYSIYTLIPPRGRFGGGINEALDVLRRSGMQGQSKDEWSVAAMRTAVPDTPGITADKPCAVSHLGPL